MGKKFGEILPIVGECRVMVQPNHDGGGVPNAITVHVVGEISIPIAVNGRVHVVCIFEKRVKTSIGFFDDLVNSVLVRDGVFASGWNQIAINSQR